MRGGDFTRRAIISEGYWHYKATKSTAEQLELTCILLMFSHFLPSDASFFFPKVTLNHGRPVPAVLLANKSDQLASQQPKLDSFCRENGFVAWFETSAKVREKRCGTRGVWCHFCSERKFDLDGFTQIIEHTSDFYANSQRLEAFILITQMIKQRQRHGLLSLHIPVNCISGGKTGAALIQQKPPVKTNSSENVCRAVH